MDKVRALEEMFIPFCKKYPEKVFILLVGISNAEG